MDSITALESSPPPADIVTVAIPATGFVNVTPTPAPVKLIVLTLFADPTNPPSSLTVIPVMAFAIFSADLDKRKENSSNNFERPKGSKAWLSRAIIQERQIIRKIIDKA